MADELPSHPWPEKAEEVYQESLKAALNSAMFMAMESQVMREWGFAEWARSRVLAEYAISMVKPPRIILVMS